MPVPTGGFGWTSMSRRAVCSECVLSLTTATDGIKTSREPEDQRRAGRQSGAH